MRKVAIAILLLTLCGCGGQEAETTSQDIAVDDVAAASPDVAAAPPPAPPPPAVPDAAAVDEPANGGAMANGREPASLPARIRDEVFCPRLQDRATPEECEYYEQVWANLATGAAGFDAPERMKRGDTATVTFAISRSPGEEAVERTLGGEADEVFETKVGRRMAALLQGEGFEIEPEGLQEKDLFIGEGARWQWEITAVRAPRHRLSLSAYVVVGGDEGRKENLLRTVSRDIEVEVTAVQATQDFMEDTLAWLKTGENWLKALAGFIVALGLVWLAVRNFGKKSGAA